MRVTIEHVEKTKGWISKTTMYGVTCHVDFTDEERHIIENSDIKTVTVLERGPGANVKYPEVADGDPTFWNLKIGALLAGPDTYWVRSPADARQYEHRLSEALPELKKYIEANRGIEEKKKTLEF